MSEWKRRLRDWWRGYSDADLRSLDAKLSTERRPGEIVPLTWQEWTALRFYIPGSPLPEPPKE